MKSQLSLKIVLGWLALSQFQLSAALGISPKGPMTMTALPGTCVSLLATDIPAGENVTWSIVSGSGSLSAASGGSTSYCPGAATSGFAEVQASVPNGAGDPDTKRVVIHIASAQGGLFQRLIAGAEGAGGAATQPTGRFFIDMLLSTAISNGGSPTFGPRYRLWVNTRLTSVPQQFDVKVSAFAAGGISSGIKDLKVNEIAQVIDMMGGLQYRFFEQDQARKVFFDNRLSRTTISAIIAYGGTTPLVPKDYISAFKMPEKGSDAHDRLRAQFGAELDRRPNATTLAFVPLDRQRFWRQYYGGVRIQSHFYEWNGAASTIPMRSVDLMVGQNESVTGGRLHGPVLRADFFQPIVNFNNSFTLYVFGTASWRPTVERNAARDALVLETFKATEAMPLNLTAPTTLLLTAPPSNRDYFRFGVGIDFKRVFGGN